MADEQIPAQAPDFFGLTGAIFKLQQLPGGMLAHARNLSFSEAQDGWQTLSLEVTPALLEVVLLLLPGAQNPQPPLTPDVVG